jgi:hypothetical protein
MASTVRESTREHPSQEARSAGAALLRRIVFLGVSGSVWWTLSGHLVGSLWYLVSISVVSGALASLLFRYLCKVLRDAFDYGENRIPAKLQDHIIEQATEHYSALSRNVNKSLKINDYGVVVSDVRKQAVLEFLESIRVEPGHENEDLYIEFVLKVLKEIEIEFAKAGFEPESAPMKGHDFEHWVARELTRFGWKARATVGTGDQGIDVVAEKYGIRVGIQCKRYASSVGNKSVQEAISGKQYHGLDVAAVLATSSFTRAAKQLAASADVVLMTHYDIPEADRRLLTRQSSSYGD